MSGQSLPLWVAYLAAVMVVIAMIAVCVIVLSAVGGWAMDSYVDARRRRSPRRRLWFAAVWGCFAMSGVVIAAGLYLFVAG